MKFDIKIKLQEWEQLIREEEEKLPMDADVDELLEGGVEVATVVLGSKQIDLLRVAVPRPWLSYRRTQVPPRRRRCWSSRAAAFLARRPLPRGVGGVVGGG